jgi:hypothetical protein
MNNMCRVKHSLENELFVIDNKKKRGKKQLKVNPMAWIMQKLKSRQRMVNLSKSYCHLAQIFGASRTATVRALNEM